MLKKFPLDQLCPGQGKEGGGGGLSVGINPKGKYGELYIFAWKLFSQIGKTPGEQFPTPPPPLHLGHPGML